MANVTTAMRLFVYKDRFKMGVIAKGEITLSNVNDAYTVSLTKTSCVVNADYDGSNPKLDEAYTTISVKRGDKKQWFKVAVISKTNDSIIITNVSMPSGGDESTLFEECIFRFDSVPTDVLEGSATIQISTEDGYVADVVFSYTVVRESTMLDWIQEWEGNKTQIGGNSIITPRLFVGKKITNGENYNSIFNVPQLTGVYIGPAGENGNSCGVYGYKAGGEIFHLDDTGGYIGGWTINTEGIYSAKGALRILASGTIKAVNSEGGSIWEIKENGDAFFAFANVKFYSNGDAEFAGTIKSKDGQIGGWTINDNNLYSTQIGINSSGKYIAIANIASIPMYNGDWNGNHFAWVKAYGGVAMYYSQNSDFGFVAYKSSSKVFSAGSVNMIAGWSFDANALWSGAKNNTIGAYTTSGITIGGNGIRGIKWYIDSNGDISFMNGMIKFTANDNGGEIVGWKLNSQRFSTDYVALVSESSNTGLYLSANSESSFNTRASSSLKDFIVSKGGVYLNVSSNNAVFGAYNSSGGKIFILQSNGTNSIAGWNFDDAVLYTGTKAASGFTASGSITLGPTGLRGYKWRFENNGSGAVAGGNISWDSAGNVTFASSVKIGWDNLGGTIINSEGVFVGKISADNITAGTISTADICNKTNTWRLNQDGSGALANGNVVWDSEGNVNVLGSFSQKLHYAYKSDASIVSIVENAVTEPDVTLRLENQLYLVTNIVDWNDSELAYTDEWPYKIYPKAYYKIYLPVSPDYIGKEIKIYDCNFGPFTRLPTGWCDTVIRVDGGNSFATKVTYDGEMTKDNLFTSIQIRGGYVSFVGVPGSIRDGSKYIQATKWLCVDFYGSVCVAIDVNGNQYDLSSIYNNA